MSNRLSVRTLSVAAAALAVAALPAWWWGPRAVASMLLGGVWNLVSLWCLANLLGCWLRPDPSRRRVVGWLAVKCAWIGLLVGVVLRASWMSLIAFGIGFTVVLIVVVASLGLRANLVVAHHPHGR